MRLRHFIIDTQKVTTTLTGSTYTAASSPTGGALSEAIKPDLDPLVVYQGALQQHSAASDVQFYGMMVTGSLTLDHVYTGDRLKMTGSLSADVEGYPISDGNENITFQVVMVAPGENSG